MGHGQHLNLERIWRELSTSTPIPLRDLYMAINTLQTNIISLKQFTYPLNLQLQCICHCRCLEARWCQALSMFWDCTADALAWSGVRPWACSVFLLKRCLQMLQHTQVPGHEHERWVSEWLNLTAFLGTVDSEVHLVHMSRVITAYTLQSLSSLT